MSPPVPSEHELVQVFLEVLPAQAVADAHGPSLQVREHPMDPLQDRVRLLVTDHPGRVRVLGQTGVSTPAVGDDLRPGFDDVGDEALERGRTVIASLLQPDAAGLSIPGKARRRRPGASFPPRCGPFSSGLALHVPHGMASTPRRPPHSPEGHSDPDRSSPEAASGEAARPTCRFRCPAAPAAGAPGSRWNAWPRCGWRGTAGSSVEDGCGASRCPRSPRSGARSPRIPGGIGPP